MLYPVGNRTSPIPVTTKCPTLPNACEVGDIAYTGSGSGIRDLGPVKAEIARDGPKHRPPDRSGDSILRAKPHRPGYDRPANRSRTYREKFSKLLLPEFLHNAPSPRVAPTLSSSQTNFNELLRGQITNQSIELHSPPQHNAFHGPINWLFTVQFWRIPQ